MSHPQEALDFQAHDRALALEQALRHKSAHVYPVGPEYPLVTRHRESIVHHKLDWVIAGKSPAGKTETFAALFERVWGEPLTTTTCKGKTNAHT